MLVRFTVENCLSFRNRVEFSMVASEKLRRHPNHIIRPGTSRGIPLLKLAVIYGANASGKSNLAKAMSMARFLVLHPLEADRSIPLTPFKLDSECRRKPSRFEFEIKIHDRYFAYGFAISAERVQEEWLHEIDRAGERPIFSRSQNRIEIGQLPFETPDEKQFLEFTAKGTLSNRLFLTECRERNVQENVRGAKDLTRLLNWFEDTLTVVFPDSKYGGLAPQIHESKVFKEELARYLKCFDTGIEEINLDKVEFEKLDIPAKVRVSIETRCDSKRPVIMVGPNNEHWLFDRDKKGNLRSRKLVARHGRGDGPQMQATFEMGEESDGTRRLMDLVPAMMALMSGESVFVVDELDRSVHPEILHSYLANFLKYSTGHESQLIVTTHDTTLLKQSFLRRDEVWFVEKGTDQSSRLIALEEFKKAKGEKDLQRDYLQGRFGGVPVLHDFSWLGSRDGKGT